MLDDSFRHKGLRKNLIKLLEKKEIAGKAVLDAMELVPRHLFVSDSMFDVRIYEDKPFPIDVGQTISQPSTVAWQTELLDVHKGFKILEIGTGSGYQTAILLELGAKVFSIERQKTLFDKTSALLLKLNYKAKLFYGDGYKGLPAFAPFDRILVTAGAPKIPEALVAQLKVGGRMIIPLGEEGVQIMTVLNKISEEKVEKTEVGGCSFVPMLQRTA